MEFVRTPEERFENLPGYDFSPNYVQINDGEGGKLRMHYLDEGPRDGAVILCTHGEPSWSYLYRKMIPIFVAAGYRVLCPDLIGFGKSDKPTKPDDYTFQSHVDWMTQWFKALDLSAVTLVGQDWGGLIGLRLVADMPDRFARVVTANTGLPEGEGAPEAFRAWREFSQTTPTFDIGQIVGGPATTTDLAADVVAAYDAPFPSDDYKAGARIFPSLVPVEPDDPALPAVKAAWKVLEQFDKPWLCASSDMDPVTAGVDLVFLARVPGTKGQPHTTIKGAGHLLQEDKGEEFAGVIVDWLKQL